MTDNGLAAYCCFNYSCLGKSFLFVKDLLQEIFKLLDMFFDCRHKKSKFDVVGIVKKIGPFSKSSFLVLRSSVRETVSYKTCFFFVSASLV